MTFPLIFEPSPLYYFGNRPATAVVCGYPLSIQSASFINSQLFSFPQACGIKGASIFMLHHPFNMAKGFVVDDLHCVYLGVKK